ncbi:general stress protein [Sporosarcina sp. ANT_H38]|uniref:general stress protein n=1 Tax=Sporosarcina sp. ANT_H38 TaxID=2597358 RepID=UPI0011F2C3DF|nr:general stress protein [Sporosarcina sp. ANT_H38]KAA0955457.1 general stress protein [Sporosarcina sp. ANT_H38]
MRAKLEKRLSYLYTGESSAIVMFALISYLYNITYPGLRLYSLYSFWVSFFLLEFLLLQGTVYWYTKRKRLKRENTSRTPVHVVRKLKSLKKINIGLIIVSLAMFVLDFFKWYPSLPLGGLVIAGFIYVFAILEYINYFYVQISYDNISDLKNLLKSKRLKQSSISKDFRRISQMKK